MIINTEGDIIAAFWDTDGVIQQSGMFKICIPFTKEQQDIFKEMKECQYNLKLTDYKATKYAEGLYTEEQYLPIKAERQGWRDKYNELSKSYTPPHLSDEEVKTVIEKYYDKHK